MTENNVLRLIYTLFLGVLLALFIGFGINTFYPGPKPPEFPTTLNSLGKEPTNVEIAAQRNFDAQMAVHNKKMQPYNRNVAMMALTFAVILLAISMVFENRIKVIADGVMLGGLFTLLYALGRGVASQYSGFVFIIISIGLMLVLYLGYRRFVREVNHTPNLPVQPG